MWIDDLNDLVLLPRGRQYEALQTLRQKTQAADHEQWNTTFDSTSLYQAWTRLPLAQGVYEVNRPVIRRAIAGREDWRIVEIGGGNGALWQEFFADAPPGTLTLIDPNQNAHTAVAGRLPEHVELHSIIEPAETADIPGCDVLVCSLTLHHVAGRDTQERAAFGLDGVGKLEILQRCLAAIRDRAGVAVLNEADCYHEIDLAPGDPALIDSFIDAYVRRTARAVADTMARSGDGDESSHPWQLILRHWCLDEVDYAFADRADRDVYELDVASWLALLARAGARDVNHIYSDEWNLFVQYVFG
ncbi:class I SAM-dependent methyltransferase [Mycolicibacterium sp. 120270]|uniref:class I SAM-dependent methyltransferase n=1 Tax=Mycolicibacterium sp. 120270 TaxID=3090600 RepID=UPI00299D9DAE|nr:class I SAM-dependent methyltransferase [Mycolicibacterium sp. 120270]MDX1886667.1 class I SAM-dependent methyltransferase [Mycolicibacterium sp. 120270]